MRKILMGGIIGLVLLVASGAAAQNIGEVSQGSPGKKGPWFTVSQGLTTVTYSEKLVGVAATAMPTSATARSITLQNIGPDAIYCGFTNGVTLLTGIKIGTDQGATFDLSAAPAVYCITTVVQVAGTGTRVILSDTPNTVRLYGGGGASGGGGAVTAFAPGVPSTVTLSASTSASKCALTAGADYEISCTVASAWRHGAATPTALLTDNPLPAGAIRSPVRMPTGSTCFAFISTSAGSCTVSLLPTE